MVAIMPLYHGYKVLFAILVCTAVDSSVLRGPDNVVGTVDEDVTLNCHTNGSQDVKWSFTPIGLTASVDKSKFPGHHCSTLWSSRGHHSLTLEGVQFQNAGRYVCRVVGSTSEGGMDAAAAFVVVVADAPRCKDNITAQLTYKDSVSLECSVTFLGQHNLTLEWIAPDGQLLSRQRYRSGDRARVARLRLIVNARTARSSYNLSTRGYTCRAYFSNRSAGFVDEASNSPEFRRNTCAVLVPAPTVSPADASTLQPPPPASSKIAQFVAVATTVGLSIGVVVTVLVIVIVVCVCFGPARIKATLQKGRRQNDGGPSDNPESVSDSARCVSQYDNATAAGGSEMKPLISSKDDKCCGGETADDFSESRGKEVVDMSSQNEPELSEFACQKDSGGPATDSSKIAESTDDGRVCPSDNSSGPNGPQTRVRVINNAVLPTIRQEPANDSPNSIVASAVVHRSLEPPPLNNSGSDRRVTQSETENTRASVQEHDSDMPGEESTTRASMIELHPKTEDQVESDDK